jgi:MFS family permease
VLTSAPERPAASAGGQEPSARAANVVGLLFWAGWLAASPFLGLYATSLGANPATVGGILGGYHIVALALSLPAGVLTERWGSGRVMLLGCAVGIAGTLVLLVSRGLGPFTFGLLLAGVAQVTVSIGTQTETILAATRRTVARAMGQYMFFTSFAQIAGPVLGGILVRDDNYRAVFLGATALMALGAVASLAPARRVPVRGEIIARSPTIDVLVSTIRGRASTRAALISSLLGELVMAFWGAFFPLLLASRGYTPGAVAFYFSLRAIANTASRPLVLIFTSPRFRARALITGLIVTAGTLGLMPFVAPSPVGTGVLIVVFGLAAGLYFTLLVSIVAQGFPPQAAGMGVATRLLMTRVGVIVGPLALGVVVQALGMAAGFIAGTGIMGLIAWIAFPRRRARRHVGKST